MTDAEGTPVLSDSTSGTHRYLLAVEFQASPVVIEVEAESMRDAWDRRYELAASAEPLEWEVHPTGIEGPTGTGGPLDG